MRRILPLIAFMLLAGSVIAAEPDYLSPSAVAVNADAHQAVVAAATANRLLLVDLAAGTVTASIDLPGSPNGICLSADEAHAYVTIDGPEIGVCVVDLADQSVARTIPAGHTPMSPLLTADGAQLWVCNRFSNTIGLIELGGGEQIATIPVQREPMAIALTPDGASLVVVNHLPMGVANGYHIASTVQIIDTASKQVSATIDLPNGSTDCKDVALSPDGRFAYVGHILGRYQVPTTQLERGWMNTNAVSVIDLSTQERLNTALLDNIDRGAPNPWAVAVSPDGEHLLVSHAGYHELSLIDRKGLHAKMDKAAAGERVSEVTKSAEDMPNDLTTMVGIRQRVALPGQGPRAMAVNGDVAVVADYFSDSLSLVDLAAGKPATKALPLGPPPEMTLVRQGEIFFHDASLCFQQWQSCASCHPDARVDALNWDLLNDGIGNARSSKSMLLAHELPPAMITGVRAHAKVAVRAGIRFIQFAVRPEEDAVAIDAYLMSLKPVPSPYLVDGQLSSAAERGKALFNKVGCNNCHSGPYYTDQQAYDVGTGIVGDDDRPLDTPTLIECWRTAPYLNDGRAATMVETLKQHGNTASLNESEMSDLAEFVLSL